MTDATVGGGGQPPDDRGKATAADKGKGKVPANNGAGGPVGIKKLPLEKMPKMQVLQPKAAKPPQKPAPNDFHSKVLGLKRKQAAKEAAAE